MAGGPAALRRIGLYGGTFDPVHTGHLELAQAAWAQLKLDELRWLPAGSPWQKRAPHAPGEHRVAMLRLAIGGLPASAGLIDERELHRAGPSYTIDTIEELERELPAHHAFLIIGQDQYAKLDTWHRWRDVVERVTLAVVARNGQEPVTGAVVAAAGPSVQVLRMQPVHVSSTDIRHHLSQGRSVAGMVPAPVARYIEQHGLYR